MKQLDLVSVHILKREKKITHLTVKISNLFFEQHNQPINKSKYINTKNLLFKHSNRNYINLLLNRRTWDSQKKMNEISEFGPRRLVKKEKFRYKDFRKTLHKTR